MNAIQFKGVRTHNLKNFDLTVPHQSIVVFTGVSGSGKSSLAFDTLYAEGQRRYVESLSAYARQFLERMEKPDIDSVTGILPAIAIEAKNVVTNARSTVGTQTEINDYLRVFFARVGQTFCARCGKQVAPDRPEAVAEDLIKKYAGEQALVLFNVELKGGSKKYLKECLEELEKQGFVRVFAGGKAVELTDLKKSPAGEWLQVVADRLEIETGAKSRIADSIESAYRYGKGHAAVFTRGKTIKLSEGFHCAECDLEYKHPTPNMFSFNSPLGACPECQGFGRVITIDRALVIPDENKSLEQGAIEPWTKPSSSWFFEQMVKHCRRRGIPLGKPFRELSEKHKKILWEGDASDPDFESIQDFFDYLEKKTYKMHVRVFLSKYRTYVLCPKCLGARLKPEALLVRVDGKNIARFQAMTVREMRSFFQCLELSVHDQEMAGPVLIELKNRLSFLEEVGLGYLTLDRLSRTLSGGEAQRINLATSLGSSLVDTLYVLDEPSIGLHERDNELLIRVLRKLRDLGNTVVVVEHDRQMIETADQIVDLGPYAGEKGGRLVFQGTYPELLKADTLTGRYLSGRQKVTTGDLEKPRSSGKKIRVAGAAEHNLKNINVEIPLGCFVVMTGVSGSGKSTFLYDILYAHYQRFRGRPVQDLGKVRSISGWEGVGDMVLVDQSPIGRTPRSNPITYIKAFDGIRKIFAATEQAKRLGLSPGDFSFNVEGGRCEECEGNGQIKVEMHFLADIYVECEKCQGRRYQKKILDIRHKEKNIHDVLSMTFDAAAEFFSGHADLVSRLPILQKIGLGYLRLGQSALTLSAGEAQRMKLALEMTEARAEKILYLFDEPTTGLHYHDIRYLLQAFRELLSRGHSIVVIEHNMEVIQQADYVIDLGPEGGEEGGAVVFSGTLTQMMKSASAVSHTAVYLKKYLEKQVSNPLAV